MKRKDLEHLIRAAGAIIEESEILVIGSQSILGEHPDAPAELTMSSEADLGSIRSPEKWNLIDVTLGELSGFHQTFGYYAQGIEPKTAILPRGWETRLVPINNVNTLGITGRCLETHDLVASKLFAGREKDIDFCTACIRHEFVDCGLLRSRLIDSGQDRCLIEAALTKLRICSSRLLNSEVVCDRCGAVPCVCNSGGQPPSPS